MNRKLIASLLILLLICFWASSAFALSIGSDTVFDVARTVVFPEDGSGGIAAADAIQFNTGFTIAAFFGKVAFFLRACLEIWK
jgi:hypothetical protein